MAINYNFKGIKGNRKVVKTIDIHEESYDAICKMISNGMNSMYEPCGPFLEDAYNMFGGNCYGMIVSMAISCLISDMVNNLEERCLLVKDGEEVYCDLHRTILPTMCYVKDEDGAAFEELRFFCTDADEIISGILPCLTDEAGNVFTNNLREAIKNDNRPAGEIALGILMYIGLDVVTIDNNAN